MIHELHGARRRLRRATDAPDETEVDADEHILAQEEAEDAQRFPLSARLPADSPFRAELVHNLKRWQRKSNHAYA